MTGMFAISKAGHDQGKWYLIIRADDEYVYLADGKIRTIDNPKKKRKKHIQLVKTQLDQTLMEKINNEEIKYAIKCRCKEVTHVKG